MDLSKFSRGYGVQHCITLVTYSMVLEMVVSGNGEGNGKKQAFYTGTLPL